MNREDELASLRSWWHRPDARPAPVWGRRRVGKTALLQHFAAASGVPVVFHTGTGEAAGAEVATLSRHIAALLPDPLRNLDGEQEIDAVVLAQRDLARVPVLAGESKWARSVNAVRIKAGLIRKTAGLAADPGQLTYAICAREQVEHADADTLMVTAADIFAG